MNEKGRYKPHHYYHEFDDWDTALEAAGIHKGAALIKDIRNVAQEIDGQPNTTDMARHGHYSPGMFTVYFGSWDNALKRAGFAKPQEPVSSTEPSATESSDGSDDETTVIEICREVTRCYNP